MGCAGARAARARRATSGCSTRAAAPGGSPSSSSSACRTARSWPSMARPPCSRRRRGGWRASVTACAIVQADLARPPLPIDGQVDAILSTATFHWVLDHDALFTGLAGALRTRRAALLPVRRRGQRRRRSSRPPATKGSRPPTASTWPGSRRHADGWQRPASSRCAPGWSRAPSSSHHARTSIEYIVTPYLRPATGLPEAGAAAAGGRHGRPPRRPGHRLRAPQRPRAQGLVSRAWTCCSIPRPGWRC